MTNEDYATLGLQAPLYRIHPPGAPQDVASLIERAATMAPDAEAVDDGKVSYTFAEMAKAVTAATGLFYAAGVRPGDRVAASLGNDVNIIIAFFAVMRLGAVWVGINKILPGEDKRYILEHSESKLLLTDLSLVAQVETHLVDLATLKHVWYIDSGHQDGGWTNAMVDGAPVAAPPVMIDPFAPAAIMYTSGTTGVPKGVVHSQHNLIVAGAGPFAHGLLKPMARRGSSLPLTITNIMIIGPISAFQSCKPFLIAPSSKIDALVEWFYAKRVEMIAVVPAMIYDLLKSHHDLPDYLMLVSGGAPLPHVMREQFLNRYGYNIMTSYGLTEAPTVIAQPMDGVAPEGASGRALPQLEITIRDADGMVLPAGEVGEVCFGAVGTGPWANVYTPPLGYWRDAEKTAALLQGGVVHTGDHGSLDEAGWLSIADRSSELILRGGSNVYPAEIERVLHMHDDVADCAIVGKPDLRMGMLTVAFIQPASPDIDHGKLIAELSAMCEQRLVKYKNPDEWQILESFPRNAMGKVVKPKLREFFSKSG